MSIEVLVQDAVALIEYLCAKFGKAKIYLVGYSWGSVLGVLVSQRCPERVAAYIGMGQAVDFEENERVSYQLVLEEAHRRCDKKAIRHLKSIGEPINGSYGSFKNLVIQRGYLNKYGGATYKLEENILNSYIYPVLTSPEYTLIDLVRYAKGSFYSLEQLWDEITETIRFNKTVENLKVPIYLTMGTHDWNTPISITQRWFDGLKAPYKEWILFEESAHCPMKEEPELWGKIMREKCLQAVDVENWEENSYNE
jgi:pimeloyl-ACP methyl ester carboxylesterase